MAPSSCEIRFASEKDGRTVYETRKAVIPGFKVLAVDTSGAKKLYIASSVKETSIAESNPWLLPLIAVLYNAGAGISVLITYSTSFATLSLLKVPLEVGFYGWRLTGLRLSVSLVLPIIAGLSAQAVLPLIER
jgi:hypothetical protein